MTDPSGNGDDPVARNRAAHPRKTPGRVPVGYDVSRLLAWAIGAMLVVVTVVLVAIVALAG